ncbi:winged helix-turn-helix domain-containing protein [Winogradskyella sp. 3972H.M.0a.05]|uniref:winged helix-turn-helix domain-containing protein n=1 Tax=Winogradskyella sp. 3972H.M.0a.05 TaxID=2950277 RepID=UPI003399EC4E
MNKRKIYIYSILGIITVLWWLFSKPEIQQEDFPEAAKIALRDTGNQLLLASNDSTSLVLPIKQLSDAKYQLAFQSQLEIHPDSLVSTVQRSLKKAQLPEQYRVEVKQCVDDEVAYSYEVQFNKEEDIVPCLGRLLPESCYTIDVQFIKGVTQNSRSNTPLYLLATLLIIVLMDYGFSSTMKTQDITTEDYESLGSFKFYPEQNKLVREAVEINLSKKECELLAIFVDHSNQVVKRDELTKRVWEDNGVIVGRSLDTYVSKLRKKLQDDNTIKLTNVHGVGYKLEVN